jgi:hypothetical protein
MPFLVVGAVTLAVTEIIEVQALEVGDRYETFDGSERTSVSAYKRRWEGVTRPLTPAEFATYRAALIAAPPLACSGDALGGATSCSATITSAPYVRDGVSHRQVIEFELREQ